MNMKKRRQKGKPGSRRAGGGKKLTTDQLGGAFVQLKKSLGLLNAGQQTTIKYIERLIGAIEGDQKILLSRIEDIVEWMSERDIEAERGGPYVFPTALSDKLTLIEINYRRQKVCLKREKYSVWEKVSTGTKLEIWEKDKCVRPLNEEGKSAVNGNEVGTWLIAVAACDLEEGEEVSIDERTYKLFPIAEFEASQEEIDAKSKPGEESSGSEEGVREENYPGESAELAHADQAEEQEEDDRMRPSGMVPDEEE